MKPTLVFYLNSAKQSQKNSLIPIYFRVIQKGLKAEAKLPIKGVVQNEVLKWDMRTMRFVGKNNPINSMITEIENEFNNFLLLNRKNLSQFSASEIRNYLVGNTSTEISNGITVVEYINAYFENTILPKRELRLGSKKNYKKAINHLKKYLHFIKKEKLTLKEFNNKTAIEFMEYLQNNYSALNKTGMAVASASGNIKKLITIFNKAIDEEIITKNPFKSIKLNHKSQAKPKLSIHLVKAIYCADLKDTPILGTYRDIFMFSVFTGLAYSDIMSLTKNHIVQIKNNQWKISKNRFKTDILTEVGLVYYALDLIKKYENTAHRQILNSIFPQKSNQKVNTYLKILASKCGITIYLTSHIARHSFSQLLSEAGVENSLVLDKMMGHSSENYIGSKYRFVSEDNLIDAKNKFEQFLKNNLDANESSIHVA